MPRRLTRCLIALLGLAAACGGPPERVVTPFTEEHEAVFDNGLDLVRDPDTLEGAWLGSWEEELDGRITLADLVLLITVQTVRHDTDLDRRDTYRLHVRVDEEYLGDVEDEIELVVRQDERGFDSIEGNVRRILDEQFIAFVKWQRDEETGGVRARWHLSMPTEDVASRTRTLLQQRRDVQPSDPGRRRVIIRRN